MLATTAGPARMLPTLQIHDGKLASLLAPVAGQRIGIAIPDLLDDRLGRKPLTQEIERLRTVADVENTRDCTAPPTSPVCGS